jgi:hypothetical protein
MEIPRDFSSFSRSVSTPVNAFDERRLAVVDMAGRADDHSGPTVKPSGFTPANPAASVS